MNKSIVTIIGFLLFLTGSVALILTLVGLRLTFLAPIEALGGGLAFIIKIIMILAGIVIVYIAKSPSGNES